jgi:flagellin-like hook-associated protein FlgL
MELGNLIKVAYGVHVITGAYNQTNNQPNAASDDDAAASVIQYLLHGKMSEGQENERYVSEAISMTQRFADATREIREKLQMMEGLAEKAASTGSKEEKEELQEEFEQLAGEINDIVENTEYNGNKLLSADGKTVSISIGNGSTIDVVSKDLSIDIDGLDLTTDAEGVLVAIRRSVSESSYYSGYLEEQVSHLESMACLIEFEIPNDMGIEADEDEFDMALAKEVAGYASSQTLEDMSVLFEAQANVEPNSALQLLQDRIEELKEELEEDAE